MELITGRNLAKKILDQIDLEPETLCMSAWELQDNELWDFKTGEALQSCGTTRCVAGWAVYFNAEADQSVYQAVEPLASRLDVEPNIAEVAASLLEIPRRLKDVVFYGYDEGEAYEWLKGYAEEGTL